jgi:hypothetical protein
MEKRNGSSSMKAEGLIHHFKLLSSFLYVDDGKDIWSLLERKETPVLLLII